MYRSLLLPASWIITLLNCSSLPAQSRLPAAPKRPVTDTYFGKQIIDNYRWLENMNSPETKA